MPGSYALIVAAGRGHRFGGEIPKQYRALGGMSVLRHSAETLLAHPSIAGIRVVIHPDDRALYDAAVEGLNLLDPVPGGETRQDSSRNGLDSLADLTPDTVLIHDAARPFLDTGIIDRTLATLETSDAALAAVPVVDTLKREADGKVGDTVDRDGLWRAQTPQGFRFASIRAAHAAAAGQGLTDDAAVAEAAGMEVALVTGSESNFKITTEDDLARAEAMLAVSTESRTGFGFDVHQFEPGDHVTLCGVDIPHTHRLKGHSDADAGLHALTDAILGAIGEGDIGTHFPPSDPQWKGAPSDIFLKKASDLVAGRGGRISNVDITLICESPKIGPFRLKMVSRLSEILDLEDDRISVKATTTEQLGFTGRGEGLAAQAVATVLLPHPTAAAKGSPG